MRGFKVCICLIGLGVPLALLGLSWGVDRLTLAGAGMVATVVVGWPVLLLMGAADEWCSPRQHPTHRR